MFNISPNSSDTVGKACGTQSARKATSSRSNKKKSHYQENRAKGLGSPARPKLGVDYSIG